MVNGTSVHWKSKDTSLICTNSTEAEFGAIHIALNEMIWFMQLGTFSGSIKPNYQMNLFVDNMSAIMTIYNDNFSQTSKHYAVRSESPRERLTKPDPTEIYSEGVRFQVKHLEIESQLAVVLTEPII
jgi:hypothetical protein